MRIVRVDAGWWRAVQAIRLAALRDCPDAFTATLAEESAFSEQVWRARLEDPRIATFVALADDEDNVPAPTGTGLDGGLVGLATAADYDGVAGAAGLFGLWVEPSARGRGLSRMLIDAASDWARAQGYERLMLDVGVWNSAARRLYEQVGFTTTDVFTPMPTPREHLVEERMALDLG